jgi:hypothetical protein
MIQLDLGHFFFRRRRQPLQLQLLQGLSPFRRLVLAQPMIIMVVLQLIQLLHLPSCLQTLMELHLTLTNSGIQSQGHHGY